MAQNHFRVALVQRGDRHCQDTQSNRYTSCYYSGRLETWIFRRHVLVWELGFWQEAIAGHLQVIFETC